jgi:glucose-1-phosphate adenylyltransferase
MMKNIRFSSEPGWENEFDPQYEMQKAYQGKIVALVLAGENDDRLHPLTEHRTKAAIPFGGVCRLIDFVISNMVNSGINDISILTQDRAGSLIRHLQRGLMISEAIEGYFLKPVPPPLNDRYLGTANAVFKNLGSIRKGRPDLVLVFGADQVYTCDIRPMIRWHVEKNADITVSTIPLPVAQCGPFETVSVDADGRIEEFREKSALPQPLPGQGGQALVSTGNYIFNPRILYDELNLDSLVVDSSHDFGRDVLPKACRTRRVYSYDFRKNVISDPYGQTNYWRDVGTIESYFRASMELNDPLAPLNLYHPHWPLRSVKRHAMPAKVMADRDGLNGSVKNSILGSSTIVSGATVRDSVIGPNVRIASQAVIEESVILGEVQIEKGARIRRTIIDHNNFIGEGRRIGYDRDQDAALYHLDPSGIVVVPHTKPAERNEIWKN